MHLRRAMAINRRLNGVLRGLFGLSLLLFAGLGWLLAAAFLRVLSGLAILLFAARIVAFVAGKGHQRVVSSGLAVAVLILSPIEVAAVTRPGLPGLVRVVVGYPGPEALERERRGEVILLGCTSFGLEPRWVLVW
jgi:hypothetical protein